MPARRAPTAAPASAADLRAALRAHADPVRAAHSHQFFQAGPGGYGEGDKFLGVRVPETRAVVRAHRTVPLETCLELLRSAWHEERLLALLLMVRAYERGDAVARTAIFDAYLTHLKHIDNWDLVDSSAPQIVGAQLGARGTSRLAALAKSPRVWTRRVAMLATFHQIRAGNFAPALRIATLLRHDPHDMLHKAVGWMLREVGERDRAAEVAFLDQYWHDMPRTAVRYAIEHFTKAQRQRYTHTSPRTR